MTVWKNATNEFNPSDDLVDPSALPLGVLLSTGQGPEGGKGTMLDETDLYSLAAHGTIASEDRAADTNTLVIFRNTARCLNGFQVTVCGGSARHQTG